MKAIEARFLDFMRKSTQFEIPIYQRTYSWTEKQCRQLWEDILRCGSDDAVTVHFIGSVVYIEKGLNQVVLQSPRLVIDGQQRLTTITLILTALAEALGESEPIDGFSGKKLRNNYLLNPDEDGERYFKLVLTQTDRSTLMSIVGGTELHSEKSVRIAENYKFFKERIASMLDEIEVVCKGLAKLVLVDIALDRDHDNPQLIFESMNSTGKELSQADLIRNFILMGLETDLQKRLYENYWRPMEQNFGQEGYATQFDGFMRHYLTVKTGSLPKVGGIYDDFKIHSHKANNGGAGVEELVEDIRKFAGYYCSMALGKEPDNELRMAFDDLREMTVNVAYPFLLELYDDYATGVIPKDDFLQILRLVESYVFRRAVCDIRTNSLNTTFATFSKEIKKDRYLESVKAHFLLMPGYRRFPRDEEFHRAMQQRDLYNFPRRNYFLRRFENFGRQERVHVDDYTTEHIMPQNKDLSEQWKASLGQEWEQIHDKLLHTLGNLTLTGYNSEYSDRPFNEKRDMEGGFKDSPIRLNEGLGNVDVWNEDAIKARAEKLSTKALDVWVTPSLSSETLSEYRAKPSSTAAYSIDDHPYLKSGKTRELFEAFRKEVLALDLCVTEVYLRRYIAYKAETNFVDVVPQSNQLRLTLNLKFSEIRDPRRMCTDVSEIGTWGNGDVDVQLREIDELEYVLRLVRQSLGRQLGNGDDS